MFAYQKKVSKEVEAIISEQLRESNIFYRCLLMQSNLTFIFCVNRFVEQIVDKKEDFF